jgi:hypothetical protein
MLGTFINKQDVKRCSSMQAGVPNMTERQIFLSVLNLQLHQSFNTDSPRQFENLTTGNCMVVWSLMDHWASSGYAAKVCGQNMQKLRLVSSG